MTQVIKQVFFHCSSAGVPGHSHCVQVRTIGETPDLAARFIRALLTTPGDEDWRNWVLRVCDTDGEVLMVVPFASQLGKPH
jgi:hypothetical protein